jgi:tetratricopeptide (TPR) repeat protein
MQAGLDDFELAQGAASRDQRRALKVASDVYQALGFMTLGHRQLAEGNPDQAVDYATRALNIIDVSRDQFPNNVDLVQSLDELAKATRILRAQSYAVLGKTKELESDADDLFTIKCNCDEANHFKGLALLDRATDENTNEGERSGVRKEAIKQLSEAAQKSKGATLDRLLLAAAYFDGGNYGACRSICAEAQRLLRSASADKQASSDKNIAHLDVVEAWAGIAAFADNPTEKPPLYHQTCFAPGSFGPIEGRVLQRLFGAAKRRFGKNPPSNQGEAIGLFCDNWIKALELATEAPCVAGWRPLSSESGNKKKAPAPLPE